MKGGFLHLAAAVAVSTFSISLAAAPAPSNAPPAPTPGQVQSTLPTKPTQPKQAPSPAANQAPSNAQGVAPGGPTFRVNSFTIAGNTVISTDELQAQIAGYLGKDLTLAQLYDVADVLTRYYRSRGYGLAYVTPPAQKLSAGNVRLQVVEGRVGNIDIQGNSRTRTPVLRRRTQGLNSGDIYTNAAAERAVLLMNDLPGVQSHAVLSAGTEVGTSDVLFNVDERAFGGDFSADDYGRAAIGRWRVNVDANVNSLTGNADQLAAGITHSEGNLLNFGKLAYAFPMGSSGTLTTSFNRAFYHVDVAAFAKADIKGSTQNGGVNWQWAGIRTQAESLFWGVGVTHNTSRSEASGTETVTTNITLLQLTMLYNHQYADQSYYNLNGSFWTNGKSNSDATRNDAEKAHLQIDMSWVKPFADIWDFVAQGSLAYSPDPLVDSDKYSLGGPGNVRGFQSAEARGDRGLFASLEMQRVFTPSATFPLAWGFFVDGGEVWTKAVAAGPATGTGVAGSHTALTSVGTELQLLPSVSGWNARLQLAWGVGKNRPSDDTPDRAEHAVDKGPHVWLSVGKSF